MISEYSEHISKEFLEQVLGYKIESFSVEAGTKIGDNYSSVIYAIVVNLFDEFVNEFDGKNYGKTLHIISKWYPTHPLRQDALVKMNAFWSEVNLLKVWIPELKNLQHHLKENVNPAMPPLIAGRATNYSNEVDTVVVPVNLLDNFIMMVDLRKTWGFKMHDRLKGQDRDHVMLTVTALAEYHALGWAYKQRNQMPTVKSKFSFIDVDFGKPTVKELWKSVSDPAIDARMKELEQAFGAKSQIVAGTAKFVKNKDQIANIIYGGPNAVDSDLDDYLRIKPNKDKAQSQTAEVSWRVTLHGDCWTNNMLFRYNEESKDPEEVILVDLQMPREGCPTSDVAYFLYTSTDAEFRTKYLDSTLLLYCNKFVRVCELLEVEPPPSFSLTEFKRRFHRSRLFGYWVSLFFLPLILLDPKDAVDMDTLKGNDIGDMFEAAGFGTAPNNTVFQQRLLETAQEMYTLGVI